MKGLYRIRVAAALAAAIGLTAFAAFAQTAPQITSGPTVAEAEVTDSSAIVRWQTNVESTTIVNFGKTSGLGQEFKKIVPVEETEITEVSHNMTLWGLESGTTYFYQVRSYASGLIAQSAIFEFKTKSSACAADTWDCGVWGTCAKGTDGKYAQSRSCAIKDDCPTVETPKPAESQACTPACTADTWDCAGWATCSASGNQTRTCVLKTDCPAAETPKPDESQSCVPACTADKWACSKWDLCAPAGTQTRTCVLSKDCPTATTPKPDESQKCSPDRLLAEAQKLQHSREAAEKLAEVANETDKDGVDEVSPPPPPASAVQDFEKNTENVSGGFGLMGAPGVTTNALSGECAASGILPERCDSWLEVKYADKSCATAGLSTKEACEKFLSDKAGGVFPGCEGKTTEECDAVKSRATLGYMPEEEKKKVDDIITTKKVGEAFDELGAAAPLLVAVRKEKKDEVRWWPSAKVEGQETSPGVIIFDTDKDGLPDDVEKRLGTDPRKSDLGDADGVPNAKVSREVLKSFFEKGDRPTEFVLVDTDGDGKPDLIEDKKFLGLRTYDPSRVYLIGDTTVFSDAGLGVDTDGDGKLNGKVSRDILKSFFEKGDKPSSGQFGDVIDSAAFSAVDLAFLRGNPLGQPRGTGEVDLSFTVTLGAAGEPSNDVNDVNRRTTSPGGQDVNEPVPSGERPLQSPPSERFACRSDEDCGPEYPFCRDGYCYGNGQDVNGPLESAMADTTGVFNPAKWNVLSGRATPNTTVLLYVYSYVPMVLTTTTDENGNYSYDLADNVVDGRHEVYVAVTDDTGKIARKSEPLAFFVKGAIAASSEEDFLKADVNVQPEEAIVSYARYYLYGTIVLVLIALGFGWRFMSRMKGQGESKA